jgi:hypothetical protein
LITYIGAADLGRWGDDPHTRKGRERKKAPRPRPNVEKEFINSFSTNFLRVETLTLPHPTPADPHEKKKNPTTNSNSPRLSLYINSNLQQQILHFHLFLFSLPLINRPPSIGQSPALRLNSPFTSLNSLQLISPITLQHPPSFPSLQILKKKQ